MTRPGQNPEDDPGRSQRDDDVQSRDEAAEVEPVRDLSLKEQLEATAAERDANRDNWLRAQAELENYRRRAQREAEEMRQYQSLPLARDLLPALDNLHRALAAAETSQNVADLVEGIRMVAKQCDDALGKHGIKPIDAAGKPFDPNLHQAIQQLPSAEHPPMTVLNEVERGYVLKDRVVRPSVVIVSQGPPTDAPAGE
ncbi:MAG: nucleotide exchange factor GrpE [Planctomycetaceae bacterium]